MFRGSTTTSLDSKGRMGLPVRTRETLMTLDGGNLVVTIDPAEKCLLLYPVAAWEPLQRQLEALDNLQAGVRSLQRIMIGHATDVQIDGAGRILLPALLRNFAALDKTAILVGQGKKFEIWAEEAWSIRREHWQASSEEELAKAKEVINGLSI
jgi:MraZ protein